MKNTVIFNSFLRTSSWVSWQIVDFSGISWQKYLPKSWHEIKNFRVSARNAKYFNKFKIFAKKSKLQAPGSYFQRFGSHFAYFQREKRSLMVSVGIWCFSTSFKKSFSVDLRKSWPGWKNMAAMAWSCHYHTITWRNMVMIMPW